MDRPSCDQLGTTSSESPVVTCWDAASDSLTMYTCDLPPGRESNAIRWPSGDQLGEPVKAPRQFVTALGLRPSASQTQISLVPVRSERKAILSPRGEY